MRGSRSTSMMVKRGTVQSPVCFTGVGSFHWCGRFERLGCPELLVILPLFQGGRFPQHYVLVIPCVCVIAATHLGFRGSLLTTALNEATTIMAYRV